MAASESNAPILARARRTRQSQIARKPWQRHRPRARLCGAAIHLGIIAAVGGLAEYGPIIALSLASKLVGAIAGVWAAGR